MENPSVPHQLLDILSQGHQALAKIVQTSRRGRSELKEGSRTPIILRGVGFGG